MRRNHGSRRIGLAHIRHRDSDQDRKRRKSTTWPRYATVKRLDRALSTSLPGRRIIAVLTRQHRIIRRESMATAPRQRPMSEAEWQARQQLAACYRIFAHMGWDELIYNHISLRVPEEVIAVHQRDITPPGQLGAAEFAAMTRIIDRIDKSWRD
jgi:hypothetical protein